MAHFVTEFVGWRQHSHAGSRAFATRHFGHFLLLLGSRLIPDLRPRLTSLPLDEYRPAVQRALRDEPHALEARVLFNGVIFGRLATCHAGDLGTGSADRDGLSGPRRGRLAATPRL